MGDLLIFHDQFVLCKQNLCNDICINIWCIFKPNNRSPTNFILGNICAVKDRVPLFFVRQSQRQLLSERHFIARYSICLYTTIGVHVHNAWIIKLYSAWIVLLYRMGFLHHVLKNKPVIVRNTFAQVICCGYQINWHSFKWRCPAYTGNENGPRLACST